MKFFTGYLAAAGLVLLGGGAQAQVPGPHASGRYVSVSDFDAPYAVAPRPVPGPYYGAGPQDGYGPSLLPSTEVYAVLRDNGFSPLGIPRLRGFVYTIAVIDRGGEDGRLTIDARNGRIIRFVPSDRMEGNFYEEQSLLRNPPAAAPVQIEGTARPPRPAPHVATRAVPVPKPSPLAAKPETAPFKPAPVKQASVPEPKPVETRSAAPAATDPVTTGSASDKPATEVAPTQDMPKMQGLE